ncbi:GNAT family N-acetyltransferase [Roseisalinus antarcticus]|uniref:N-acyltransferase YncA n=1 Tax=Roseisalinus antarcticus TaxID=254357 RepID=A0A1Y5SVA4_9RHOB|nr:GNAT family N-acetyltransferase [Roseisalinus antarcticus]SLN47373.1 N-acyltransferase YncA [Roseisalinus antarcticus]
MIRTATPADALAIAEIWNHYIRVSTNTFASIEKTEADIAMLLESRPIFVADQAGNISGFAHWGPFRGADGYRHTAEHTVYLRPDTARRGTGRALMAEVEAHAAAAGIHTIWAAISAENAAGIAFHERLGYTDAVRLNEVGRKFDRWLDLVLMQKRL